MNAQKNIVSVIAIAALIAFVVQFSRNDSFAADIKPCPSCALQRLISTSVRDINYENSDSLESGLAIDYAVLERIIPSTAPKVLSGFTPDDQAALARFFARETFFRSDDVIASYETKTGKVLIKHSDLEKSVSGLPYYQNDTGAIVFATSQQKKDFIHNIIKTNLLFEEGMADFKKYESRIIGKADYQKTNIYQAAFNALINGPEFSALRASGQGDIESAVRGKMMKEIDFSLQTENVLLLRKIKTFEKYDGELKLKLASFKNGTVTLADIKNLLEKNNASWVSLMNFPDVFFVENLSTNLIFPAAYASYLIAENKCDLKAQNYDEYLVYTISEAVLNDLNDSVKVSKTDCEKYFNKNSGEFKFREGLVLSHFTFGAGQLEFFKKLVNEKFKDVREIYSRILSADIACDTTDNQKFYRGQLDPLYENYLFGLKKGSFSKIIPISSAKERFALFYISEKMSESAAGFKDVYPIIHRRLLAEKRAGELENYFNGLYQKYRVNVFLN